MRRTLQSHGGQEGHQLFRGTLVDTLAHRQDIDVVEETEEGGAGLVDGAHYGTTLVR
jgi:hypothetical protein